MAKKVEKIGALPGAVISMIINLLDQKLVSKIVHTDLKAFMDSVVEFLREILSIYSDKDLDNATQLKQGFNSFINSSVDRLFDLIERLIMQKFEGKEYAVSVVSILITPRKIIKALLDQDPNDKVQINQILGDDRLTLAESGADVVAVFVKNKFKDDAVTRDLILGLLDIVPEAIDKEA